MALTQISTKGIKDGTITGTDLATNVDLVDNQKLRLGTSQDLEIYHDGTNTKFDNTTGKLLINTSANLFGVLHGSDDAILSKVNGAVELYFSGSKKFETISSGVSTDGLMNFNGTGHKILMGDNGKITFGGGLDLQIYHSGTHSEIADSGTGDLRILTSKFKVINNPSSADENMIVATEGGAVELYNAGSRKFQTTSAGATITGNTSTTGAFVSTQTGGGVLSDNLSLADNKKVKLGDSDDLQIYHSGSHSFIKDTGTGSLVLNTNSFRVNNADDSDQMISADELGAVKLFFADNLKLETKSTGVEVSGRIDITGTGTRIDIADNGKIILGDSNDLQIYHDGNHSYIDNNTGSLRLRDAGGVEKLKIHGTGITVSGGLNVNDTYHFSAVGGNTTTGMQIGNYVSSTDTYGVLTLRASTHRFDISGSSVMIINSSGNVLFKNDTFTVNNAANSKNMIVAKNNAEVELYYDGTEYASTLNTGFNVGLKARLSDYNHINNIGWALSDGWTKVVFSGSVGANTPFTIRNEHSNFNRYICYFRFDGGIANYSSNDVNLCDERVKKDFADVSSQWDNIKNIGLKHFRYKEDSSSEPLKIGVVAQQVETVYPDLVQEDWPQDDADPNTGEGTFYKSVKEEQLLMYSIVALQEAQLRIETLETKVAALEAS
tara:strand:- start:42 stop:2030 length:1989 start_codon:yes stop_codon:yes gene_type:complete